MIWGSKNEENVYNILETLTLMVSKVLFLSEQMYHVIIITVTFQMVLCLSCCYNTIICLHVRQM